MKRHLSLLASVLLVVAMVFVQRILKSFHSQSCFLQSKTRYLTPI